MEAAEECLEATKKPAEEALEAAAEGAHLANKPAGEALEEAKKLMEAEHATGARLAAETGSEKAEEAEGAHSAAVAGSEKAEEAEGALALEEASEGWEAVGSRAAAGAP